VKKNKQSNLHEKVSSGKKKKVNSISVIQGSRNESVNQLNKIK